MMFSSKFFASVYLAVVCASGALAAPWAQDSKLSTHRVREIGDFKLEAYHPESNYQTFGEGIDHPLRKRADVSREDAVKAFVESHAGFKASDVHYSKGHESDVGTFAYLKQTHENIPFANAVANIAFNSDDKVVAFGNSFVKPKKIASSKPKLTKEDAIAKAEELLDGKYNDWPATLEYVVKSDNTAALTHVVQIQNEKTGAWFEAFVDAHTGELVSVTDFVAKATYRVLPFQKEVLTQGFETLTNPEDTTSSPYGWLRTSSSGSDATTTSGNNVFAYVGSTGASQSSSGQFVYTQSPSGQPSTTANKNAAITNAFYIVNTIHDITYKYGFTEAAYNFQQTNIKSGGKAADRVLVSVQDSAGTDNADFSTPADGQSGRMRMFTWDYTSPRRDGALENDIVVHEMTHGISNRMTGGGTGRCLQTTEAGGMGEGWSDAMADWTEKTSSAVPDYVMGQYVISSSAGIRTHPYSTSATVNPLRYSSVKRLNEVHNIGEVWANMLHNVYAALVSAHGWSQTAFTDASSTAGNAVYLHLFLDAFQLQPCNPTFLTARDAWIQADANRYGGANKCTIYKAFASKGLGVNAKSYTDDSTLPSGC